MVGALTLALSGVCGLSGCQNVGPEDYAGKSFLNPGEMQRLTRNQLQLPILSSLSGLDEPSEEFVTARNVQADDLKPDSADYVIGRNDLLSISLTDVTPGVETVKTARVSESGNISLPLIGQIPAAGMTEAQLEQAIREKYRAAGIVKDAQVSVTVVEARQRTFQVRGAVARPGQYAIVQSDFRVLDALVLAGDVTVPPSSLEYMYVIRPATASRAATPATQPSGGTGTTTPPGDAQPQPKPPTGGGLLEPKPKTDKPAGDSGGGAAAPSDAPKPTGTTTLEDATKPGDASKPVFVDGNKAIDVKPADAAGPGTPAPSGPAGPDMGAPAPKGGKFEFNAPLPEDQSTVIRVPLRLLLNGELKYNIVVKPQDTLMVPTPEAGEFYMGGHVQRVGVYSLTGRQITLKQAVISAGMLDEVAIPERTEIIRRIGRDREVFVRVNLVKVFEGKQPDIFLKPYDVVQVGTNALAPFLAAIRNGFRITYGFGFLYDRNFFVDKNNTSNR